MDDVQFIDVNIGYAVGVYGIYKTTDGGQSWIFQGGYAIDCLSLGLSKK